MLQPVPWAEEEVNPRPLVQERAGEPAGRGAPSVQRPNFKK
ncbi:MAG: hypothetical protein JW384_00704 [Nitrosomonadaceae bacterium]|nr:hypothetical protein [Nitrosomonadaceae bacterium]